MSTLTVNIDGEWLVDDFQHLLSGINYLYCLFYFCEVIKERDAKNHPIIVAMTFYSLARDLDSKVVSDTMRGLNVNYGQQLILKRINYNSPGAADFLGFGKVLEQIRLYLKDRRDAKTDEERDIIIAKEKIDLYQRYWKTIDTQISALKKAGYTDAEIKEVIGKMERNVDFLDRATKEKRLNIV